MTGQPWWRPALAEFIGVFALTFIGAGSIIAVNKLTAGAVGAAGVVQIAFAHGLAIAVMVTALGHISGGHFNPAVTIAALFTRRIEPPLGLIYVVFQFLGAIVGAFLLIAALPHDWWDPVKLGTPQPATGLDTAKVVLLEAILTFFLVMVIFGVGIDEANTSRVMAGFAIGMTVTIGVLMGGPLSGAAMNPARAFGPALVSSTWNLWYVYWVGPILGGIIAGLVYDTAYFAPRRKVAPSPPVDTMTPPTSGP